MRRNWLRIAALAATAALGWALLSPRASAGTGNVFIYVHDTAGNLYTTHLDERDGRLLPLATVAIAPTGPAAIRDNQTVGFSQIRKMLVVANGNGGAGPGSLTVARVNGKGQVFPIGTTVVPGSGDLTNVLVVEAQARVLVFVSDPAPNNQVFAFTLSPTGTLAQAGAPSPTGTDPHGLASQGNMLFVANAVSTDISTFRIKPDGTLVPLGVTVPVLGAERPEVIRAGNGMLYVADCNPPPMPASGTDRLFIYRIGGAAVLKEVFNSPFTTADPSLCSMSLCGNLLLVVGLTPKTNLQTGILRKGLPSGRGDSFPLKRAAYEIGRFDPDCRFILVARSGAEADVRTFKVSNVGGRIKLIQGGVAPMPTTGTINGMVLVDVE